MAATLRLTRKAAGIELWRGRFEVTVDGSSVGTLERQDTIETPVAPGPHTLILRMGRYSSQPHTFTAADDELITLRCHGAGARGLPHRPRPRHLHPPRRGLRAGRRPGDEPVTSPGTPPGSG